MIGKNKILMFLFISICISLSSCGTIESGELFSGGQGTEEDPYRMSTAEDLRELAARVKKHELRTNSHCVMTNDIDFQGEIFTPIGIYIGSARPAYGAFRGVFDGKGFTIANIRIKQDEKAPAATGLFGHIENFKEDSPVIIKNLNIRNASVEIAESPQVQMMIMTDDDGNRYNNVAYESWVGDAAAVLVGYNGREANEQINRGLKVGGIIENCSVTESTVSVSGRGYKTGLLIGINHGTVRNCTAQGKVVATCAVEGVDQYSGGFVGVNRGGSISNCSFNGELEAWGLSKVGGFVADNDGFMEYCYSIGTAVVNNDHRSGVSEIGGFSGNNFGVIEKCHAKMSLHGEGSGGNAIGGFTAVNGMNTVLNLPNGISNCYADCDLYGKSNYLRIGGFLVDCLGDSGIIKNSYTTSRIALTDNDGTGAGQFIADRDSLKIIKERIKDCYYNNWLNPAILDVYDDFEGGLVGKSAAEMTSREFVELLNQNSGETENVWAESETSKFPELKANH